MSKKNLSVLFIVVIFMFLIIFFVPYNKEFFVYDVISPVSFKLDNGVFEIKDLETFDSNFTQRNSDFAKALGISEKEAFILGNLSKQWSINLMKGRRVTINNDDLRFFRQSYRTKFLFSGFCLVDSKPYYKEAFEKKLKSIRRNEYKVLDLDAEKIYDLADSKITSLDNFILVKKSLLPNIIKSKNLYFLTKDNVRVYFSDLTSKYIPDRNCTTMMCKEFLKNIDNAKETIDIAIYGYSSVPKIEEALKNAMTRGVKIRLVYDEDSSGKNIYPDMNILLSIIKDYKSDKYSAEARNLMHNKFYIFDNKVLITGSANLSHTDMSGFNTNSIIVIESEKIANIYKSEFEQMYSGRFHSEKMMQNKTKISFSGMDFDFYFSPHDKSITNAVLPLIKNARKYIYIPTFVLTEKRVTEALIEAKKRGVDVRIIIDALNASIKHSKHSELRTGGLLVKTENYAGKMHSKSMIVDDEYTIIGSMNFSNSGENKNDENLVVVRDSEIAKFYKEFFLYQWERIDDKWLKSNVRAEGKDSIGSCNDGIDNNYDGFIDRYDTACK